MLKLANETPPDQAFVFPNAFVRASVSLANGQRGARICREPGYELHWREAKPSASSRARIEMGLVRCQENPAARLRS